VFQFRIVALIFVFSIAVMGWVLTCESAKLDAERDRVGPLDARTFRRLTVITIGTGDVHENPERRGPATVVGFSDQLVVVDAGRAIADALRLSLIPVQQPSTVYLTNLLPVNTVGLDDLLLIGWIEGRETPLRVVGPVGTRALVDGLMAAHRAGAEAQAGSLGTQSAAPSVDVVEMAGDWSEEVGELAVRAAPLPGGPLEAFAYRFEAGGRSAVVGGTGWAPDALVDLARDANLLVHEAIFVPTPEIAEELGYEVDDEALAREAAEHTTLQDIGALAQKAGVKTLVLVRLRPPPLYDIQITSVVDDDFEGRIIIAADGDEVIP
jgi:ribonuclease BN (tRNA processing enzyme)